LAPPRFAARLHRYYGSSDFCRAASTSVDRYRRVRSLSAGDTPPTGQGHWSSSVPRCFLGALSTSCTRQISLLITFELPTIPSPTTASPFLHGRFLTLLQRRELPRLSSGQT
jgi:hypothetical protein